MQFNKKNLKSTQNLNRKKKGTLRLLVLVLVSCAQKDGSSLCKKKLDSRLIQAQHNANCQAEFNPKDYNRGSIRQSKLIECNGYYIHWQYDDIVTSKSSIEMKLLTSLTFGVTICMILQNIQLYPAHHNSAKKYFHR